MVCELVRQGKRVGITATSHKVISNLLREVVKAAGEEKLASLRCVQKVKKEDKPEHDPPHHSATVENDETLAAFLNGANVLAGTQWLWAREDYFEAVDVLFVDEAAYACSRPMKICVWMKFMPSPEASLARCPRANGYNNAGCHDVREHSRCGNVLRRSNISNGDLWNQQDLADVLARFHQPVRFARLRQRKLPIGKCAQPARFP